MAVTTNDWIIASFALWAGDWCYLEKFIKKESQKSDSKGIDDLVSRMNKNQIKRFKRNFQQFNKEKGLKKYPVIETDYIRSTIWHVSDFEYCMRGYLTDLTSENEFFRRLGYFSQQDIFVEGESHFLPYNSVINTGKNGNCITRIDEMGLIESSYHICESDPEIRNTQAIKHFMEILQKLDPGEPRYSIQELASVD
jgi:hypothetical protein